MAERPVLDAVLFDAGGTLIRLDFEWMSAKLEGFGLRLDPPVLRRAEIGGRRGYDAARERAMARAASGESAGSPWGDSQAYFGGLLDAAGVPREQTAAILEAFETRNREHGLWERAMEGGREAIDGSNALGLRCAVVSNSDGRAERHLVNCGVREGIEFVVDSQVVGVEKPDPRIVEIALERLGVPADRALFVGDIRCIDERVARSAGTHFALVDPYGDYAAPGGPAIARLEDLAGWIAARFSTPRERAAGTDVILNGAPESAREERS